MASDTYTTDGVGAQLMGTGNDNNSWGTNLNANVIQVLIDAITNPLTETVTGGTLDLSGSPPPAGPSQVHYAALIFVGTLTSNQTIIVPNLAKNWLVQNATNGAFTLKLQPSGGSLSTALPQNGAYQQAMCDGAGNIIVSPFNFAQIRMPDGSAAAPAYSDVNETNSGWYRNGTQDWRLAINGSDVLQVTGPGAGTPSVMNLIAGTFQTSGTQLVPSGAMMEYGGILAPSGWYLCAGQTATRAGDPNLLAALTVSTTGNTHSNTTLDGLAGLSFEQLNALIGAVVEGTGLQSGATVTAVSSATSCTLSLPATSTVTGNSVRFFPYLNGDGSTTFNLPDHKGRVVAGRDNMNFGSSGSTQGRLTTATMSPQAYAMAGVGGAETVTLTVAMIPSHTHNYSGTTGSDSPDHTHNYSAANNGTGGANYSTGGNPIGNGTFTTGGANQRHQHAYSGTTDGGTGGGAAHNNVQPTAVATKIIKR